jgi:hypothetical protein
MIAARQRADERFGAPPDWDIGKPVPGRHPDLLRQFVGAIHRTATVGPGDDQGAWHRVPRLLDRLDVKALPLPSQCTRFHLARSHQTIDERTVAENADDDGRSARVRRIAQALGVTSTHALQVAGETLGDPPHRWVGHDVPHDRHGPPRFDQSKLARTD